MLTKITINPSFQWDESKNEYVLVSHDGQYFTDKVALCDRAAQSESENAEKTAQGVASDEEQNANADQAKLTPFFSQEMNAQHAFDPNQLNELLTSAEAGAGGANAGLKGEAQSEEARTRNTSGFTSGLDEAARDRQKALAGSSEGVASADVLGAKQLNQEGAAGLSGLYGTDTSAMLGAMGIQNQDINTQIQAGQSGWFQNLTSGLTALGNLGKGVGAAASAFKSAPQSGGGQQIADSDPNGFDPMDPNAGDQTFDV